MNHIVFRYFGDRSNPQNHNGIICVASMLDKSSSTTLPVLFVGASKCLPGVPFVKSLQRRIAVNRLFHDRTKTSFFIDENPITNDGINDLIIHNLEVIPGVICVDKDGVRENTAWIDNVIQFHYDLVKKRTNNV